MAQPFLSDRDWTFDIGSDELWGRITAVESYRRWWPWLRAFDPVGGFGAGAVWRCVVSPPLPYIVRFTIHLDRVDRGRTVRASVTGDVRGEAELTVAGLPGDRSRARLCSRLEPANPLLRGVGAVARPVVERGHDWVLDQGRRQFIDGAL